MDVNDYLQLLSGHGLIRKYGNSDLCTVNPKKSANVDLEQDSNEEIYRQYTDAPSNYLPSHYVLPPSQQQQQRWVHSDQLEYNHQIEKEMKFQ